MTYSTRDPYLPEGSDHSGAPWNQDYDDFEPVPTYTPEQRAKMNAALEHAIQSARAAGFKV